MNGYRLGAFFMGIALAFISGSELLKVFNSQPFDLFYTVVFGLFFIGSLVVLGTAIFKTNWPTSR